MQTVVFGGEERERLAIAVYGYEREPVGDYHDDNWLSVEVAIHAGAFRGKFQAAFLTGELSAFLDQLKVLLAELRGEARFSTLEEQLTLALEGNGLGQIDLRGRAADQSGIGNQLSFQLALDQTHLQAAVRSLEAAIDAFPVRA